MAFDSFSIRLAALPALLLAALAAHAQASGGGVRIGLPGAPAASAALEVSSTSKGLLPPRLSQAQRDAIASPAAGLLVYNTSTNLLNTWNGAQWLASLPDNTPTGTRPAPVLDGSNIINLPNVINNQTAQQPGTNFNISGSGTAGDDLVADANQANDGSAAHMLRLGGGGSGEGLASKRTSGGNQYGVDCYTAGANRLSIDVNGRVGVGTSSPATTLDVNGNLRLAVRTYPGTDNSSSYTLTAADIAYSTFKIQDRAYTATLVLPPYGKGQVEGQELTIVTMASSSFTISATNADGYVTMAAIGSGGVHSAQFVWILLTSNSGRWVRTQ